jgi:hypothetical protein
MRWSWADLQRAPMSVVLEVAHQMREEARRHQESAQQQRQQSARRR